MLSESEARELMTKAANTVEVLPGPPIEQTSRKIWPMFAAAAAVVAVVGTAAAVVGGISDDGLPPAADPTTRTISPSPVLAPDQIPSVFAYDGASATKLLESRGLEVTTKPDYTCGTTGRATKTDPAVGALFQPGDVVTLYVTQVSPNARCVWPAPQDSAWRFLDFANGRGPAPGFADEVTLFVDGEKTGILTSAAAADPDNWGPGSAISEIREQAAVLLQINGSWVTPALSVRPRPPTDEGAHLPSVEGRPALRLSVDIPADGVFHIPLTVDLYRTDSRIDTVVTVTEKPLP